MGPPVAGENYTPRIGAALFRLLIRDSTVQSNACPPSLCISCPYAMLPPVPFRFSLNKLPTWAESIREKGSETHRWNAVICVRLSTSMLMGGAAEMVAHGTAVVID